MKKRLTILAILLAVVCCMTLASCRNTGKPPVEKIVVTSLPCTEYYRGDPFKLEGAVLSIYYESGYSENIPLTMEMISDFDSRTFGPQILTVKYSEATTHIKINIVQAPLASITADKNCDYRSEYVEGQPLDFTGLRLVAEYTNGFEEIIAVDESMIDIPEGTTDEPGSKRLEIVYGGKTAYVDIFVAEKEIKRVEISAPEIVRYVVGQKLDFTGSKLVVSYNNNVQERLSPEEFGDDVDVYIRGEKTDVFTEEGSTVVKIVYKGFEAEFIVLSVKAVMAEKAEFIGTLPEQPKNSPDINYGDTRLKITYNNKEVKEIPVAEGVSDGRIRANTSEYDSSNPGQYTVVLECEGLSLNIEPIVVDAVPDTLEIILPEPGDGKEAVYYQDGGDIDFKQWKFRVKMTNGSYVSFDTGETSSPVTREMFTAVNPDFSTEFASEDVGKKQIERKYTLRYVTSDGTAVESDITVPVAAREITDVRLTPPTKNIYMENESIAVAGGEITLTFNYGPIEIVPLTQEMLNGTDSAPGVDADKFRAEAEISVKYVYAKKYLNSCEGVPDEVTGRPTFVRTYPVTVLKKAVGVSYRQDLSSGLDPEYSLDTEYILGEKFDSRRLWLEISYEGGATELFSFDENNPAPAWLTFVSGEEFPESPHSPEAGGAPAFKNVGEQKIRVYYGCYIPENHAGLPFAEIPVSVTNDITNIKLEEGFALPDMTEGTAIAPILKTVWDNGAGKGLLITRQNGDEERVEIVERMTNYAADDLTLGVRSVEITCPGAPSSPDPPAVEVNILPKKIKTVSLFSPPEKLIYIAGESWDLTGMTTDIEYDNGTSLRITGEGSRIERADSSKFGYEYELGGRKIELILPALRNTAEYFAANGEYNKQVIDLEAADATLSESGGERQSVTVFGAFSVGNFKNRIIGISIEIKGNENEVYERTPLNLSESELTVRYVGAEDRICAIGNLPAERYVLTGFDENSSGTQTVTFCYLDAAECTFSVNVKAKKLCAVELKTPDGLDPTQEENFVTVKEGLPIDSGSLAITLVYTNADGDCPQGSPYPVSERVNIYDTECGYNPADPVYFEDGASYTEKSIEIKYSDKKYPDNSKTACFNLRIMRKQVADIVMTALPEKSEYFEHEEVSFEGGTARVRYDNGTFEDISLTDERLTCEHAGGSEEELEGGIHKKFEVTVSYVPDPVFGVPVETNFEFCRKDRFYLRIDYHGGATDRVYSYVYGTERPADNNLFELYKYGADGVAETKLLPACLETSDGYEIKFRLEQTNEWTSDWPKDVGFYEMKITYGGDGYNNSFEDVSHKIKIYPRPLMFKANTSTLVYGEGNPEYDHTIESVAGEAFVYDDTEGGCFDVGYEIYKNKDKSGEPVRFFRASDGVTVVNADVGTYYLFPVVTAKPDSAGRNYSVDKTDCAELEINPCPVDVVAEDAQKTYGENDPAFYYRIYRNNNGTEHGDLLGGFFAGDDGEAVTAVKFGAYEVTLNYRLTRGINPSQKCGDYEILRGDKRDLKNLELIKYESGRLKIHKKSVALAAPDIEKEYGCITPDFIYDLAEGCAMAYGETFGDIFGDYFNRESEKYSIKFVKLVDSNNVLEISLDPDKRLPVGASVGSYSASSSIMEDIPEGTTNDVLFENYKVTVRPAKVTVERAPVTIAIRSQKVTYGETYIGEMSSRDQNEVIAGYYVRDDETGKYREVAAGDGYAPYNDYYKRVYTLVENPEEITDWDSGAYATKCDSAEEYSVVNTVPSSVSGTDYYKINYVVSIRSLYSVAFSDGYELDRVPKFAVKPEGSLRGVGKYELSLTGIGEESNYSVDDVTGDYGEFFKAIVPETARSLLIDNGCEVAADAEESGKSYLVILPKPFGVDSVAESETYGHKTSLVPVIVFTGLEEGEAEIVKSGMEFEFTHTDDNRIDYYFTADKYEARMKYNYLKGDGVENYIPNGSLNDKMQTVIYARCLFDRSLDDGIKAIVDNENVIYGDCNVLYTKDFDYTIFPKPLAIKVTNEDASYTGDTVPIGVSIVEVSGYTGALCSSDELKLTYEINVVYNQKISSVLTDTVIEAGDYAVKIADIGNYNYTNVNSEEEYNFVIEPLALKVVLTKAEWSDEGDVAVGIIKKPYDGMKNSSVMVNFWTKENGVYKTNTQKIINSEVLNKSPELRVEALTETGDIPVCAGDYDFCSVFDTDFINYEVQFVNDDGVEASYKFRIERREVELRKMDLCNKKEYDGMGPRITDAQKDSILVMDIDPGMIVKRNFRFTFTREDNKWPSAYNSDDIGYFESRIETTGSGGFSAGYFTMDVRYSGNESIDRNYKFIPCDSSGNHLEYYIIRPKKLEINSASLTLKSPYDENKPSITTDKLGLSANKIDKWNNREIFLDRNFYKKKTDETWNDEIITGNGFAYGAGIYSFKIIPKRGESGGSVVSCDEFTGLPLLNWNYCYSVNSPEGVKEGCDGTYKITPKKVFLVFPGGETIGYGDDNDKRYRYTYKKPYSQAPISRAEALADLSGYAVKADSENGQAVDETVYGFNREAFTIADTEPTNVTNVGDMFNVDRGNLERANPNFNIVNEPIIYRIFPLEVALTVEFINETDTSSSITYGDEIYFGSAGTGVKINRKIDFEAPEDFAGAIGIEGTPEIDDWIGELNENKFYIGGAKYWLTLTEFEKFEFKAGTDFAAGNYASGVTGISANNFTFKITEKPFTVKKKDIKISKASRDYCNGVLSFEREDAEGAPPAEKTLLERVLSEFTDNTEPTADAGEYSAGTDYSGYYIRANKFDGGEYSTDGNYFYNVPSEDGNYNVILPAINPDYVDGADPNEIYVKLNINKIPLSVSLTGDLSGEAKEDVVVYYGEELVSGQNCQYYFEGFPSSAPDVDAVKTRIKDKVDFSALSDLYKEKDSGEYSAAVLGYVGSPPELKNYVLSSAKFKIIIKKIKITLRIVNKNGDYYESDGSFSILFDEVNNLVYYDGENGERWNYSLEIDSRDRKRIIGGEETDSLQELLSLCLTVNKPAPYTLVGKLTRSPDDWTETEHKYYIPGYTAADTSAEPASGADYYLAVSYGEYNAGSNPLSGAPSDYYTSDDENTVFSQATGEFQANTEYFKFVRVGELPSSFPSVYCTESGTGYAAAGGTPDHTAEYYLAVSYGKYNAGSNPLSGAPSDYYTSYDENTVFSQATGEFQANTEYFKFVRVGKLPSSFPSVYCTESYIPATSAEPVSGAEYYKSSYIKAGEFTSPPRDWKRGAYYTLLNGEYAAVDTNGTPEIGVIYYRPDYALLTKNAIIYRMYYSVGRLVTFLPNVKYYTRSGGNYSSAETSGSPDPAVDYYVVKTYRVKNGGLGEIFAGSGRLSLSEDWFSSANYEFAYTSPDIKVYPKVDYIGKSALNDLPDTAISLPGEEPEDGYPPDYLKEKLSMLLRLHYDGADRNGEFEWTDILRNEKPSRYSGIEYERKYTLEYVEDPPERLHVGDTVTLKLTFEETFYSGKNGKRETKIVSVPFRVRLYRKNDAVIKDRTTATMTSENTSYDFGDELPEGTYRLTEKDSGEVFPSKFDIIDFDAKFERKFDSNCYKFEVILCENDDYILVFGAKGGSEYAYFLELRSKETDEPVDSSETTEYDCLDGEGNPVKKSIAEDVNLFDGYTHRITLYIDKIEQTASDTVDGGWEVWKKHAVLVILDGKVLYRLSVGSEKDTYESGSPGSPVHNDYIDFESPSGTGLIISGCSAVVRRFTLKVMGINLFYNGNAVSPKYYVRDVRSNLQIEHDFPIDFPDGYYKRGYETSNEKYRYLKETSPFPERGAEYFKFVPIGALPSASFPRVYCVKTSETVYTAANTSAEPASGADYYLAVSYGAIEDPGPAITEYYAESGGTYTRATEFSSDAEYFKFVRVGKLPSSFPSVYCVKTSETVYTVADTSAEPVSGEDYYLAVSRGVFLLNNMIYYAKVGAPKDKLIDVLVFNSVDGYAGKVNYDYVIKNSSNENYNKDSFDAKGLYRVEVTAKYNNSEIIWRFAFLLIIVDPATEERLTLSAGDPAVGVSEDNPALISAGTSAVSKFSSSLDSIDYGRFMFDMTANTNYGDAKSLTLFLKSSSAVADLSGSDLPENYRGIALEFEYSAGHYNVWLRLRLKAEGLLYLNENERLGEIPCATDDIKIGVDAEVKYDFVNGAVNIIIRYKSSAGGPGEILYRLRKGEIGGVGDENIKSLIKNVSGENFTGIRASGAEVRLYKMQTKEKNLRIYNFIDGDGHIVAPNDGFDGKIYVDNGYGSPYSTPEKNIRMRFKASVTPGADDKFCLIIMSNTPKFMGETESDENDAAGDRGMYLEFGSGGVSLKFYKYNKEWKYGPALDNRNFLTGHEFEVTVSIKGKDAEKRRINGSSPVDVVEISVAIKDLTALTQNTPTAYCPYNNDFNPVPWGPDNSTNYDRENENRRDEFFIPSSRYVGIKKEGNINLNIEDFYIY